MGHVRMGKPNNLLHTARHDKLTSPTMNGRVRAMSPTSRARHLHFFHIVVPAALWSALKGPCHVSDQGDPENYLPDQQWVDYDSLISSMPDDTAFQRGERYAEHNSQSSQGDYPEQH